MPTIEFVVWGKVTPTSEEQILYTKAESETEAEMVCLYLKTNGLAVETRIQILNLKDPNLRLHEAITL